MNGSAILFPYFSGPRDDIAHLLKSKDGRRWTEQGNLDVRNRDGSPITRGPFGTPSVWVENGDWHLFYERNDVFFASIHGDPV